MNEKDDVPPAGGEMEVLLQARAVGNRPPSAWADVRDTEELEQMQRRNAICESIRVQKCYEFRELVDRAHVTRLQAENLALRNQCEGIYQQLEICQKQRDHRQSELTKARELLTSVLPVLEGAQGTYGRRRAIHDFLAHQSGPATKDKSDGESDQSVSKVRE